MEKYDICIICLPEDANRADTLAASLRSFKLPKGVQAAEPGLDYRRIILDRCGDSFDEKAKELLNACAHLIVICSPGTKGSDEICRRIEYFKTIRRPEDIVIALVEGEPSDSFPELFFEKKTVRHIMPDMSIVERTDLIEPVASDLRGKTKADRKQALRYETVRIVASVLDIHPDVLVQRHRRRRNRRIALVASIVSAVLLLVSGIFIRLGIIAKNEGEIAEKQTQLSFQVAERLMNELPESFADVEGAQVYIDEAVANAQSALDMIYGED